MDNVSIIRIGESSLLIEFGKQIDEKINEKVHFYNSVLNQKPFLGFNESLVSYTSITIYFDLVCVFKNSNGHVLQYLIYYLNNSILSEKFTFENKALVYKEIPVTYSGADLIHVASHNNLDVEEVIEIHCQATYTVFMMGFIPGFSYLGGLDKRIITPRKPVPQKINAGNVAIGGEQTGIYSLDSLGGWQIIGKTDINMFDINSANISYLQAGDKVKFVKI
jgi:inhibitor of KinA